MDTRLEPPSPCWFFPLQVDESGVEEKDIELVMQQANVTRSKVSSADIETGMQHLQCASAVTMVTMILRPPVTLHYNFTPFLEE